MAKVDREMPRAFVRTQRVLWAAMVLGQVAFAGLVGYRVTTAGASVSPAAVPAVAPAIGVGVLIVGVAAAAASRLVGFAGVDGADDVAVRRRYAAVTVVPLAILEAATFFSLVLIFVTGRWNPTALVAGVGLVAQVALFPPDRVRV